MRVVAVLDTWYGHRCGRAPRYSRINPYNRSGARLLWLVGAENTLLVTDSCSEMTNDPNKHGKPNPPWLAKNLTRLRARTNLILVCGNVAHRTFASSGFRASCPVIHMPHPASRFWTRAQWEELRQQIGTLVLDEKQY